MVILMGFTILLQFANLKMAIEIVDFPITHGDFPSFSVCLPEGMLWNIKLSTETIRNIYIIDTNPKSKHICIFLQPAKKRHLRLTVESYFAVLCFIGLNIYHVVIKYGTEKIFI